MVQPGPVLSQASERTAYSGDQKTSFDIPPPFAPPHILVFGDFSLTSYREYLALWIRIFMNCNLGWNKAATSSSSKRPKYAICGSALLFPANRDQKAECTSRFTVFYYYFYLPDRRVARIFLGGRGTCGKWKCKLLGGSGGVLPRENFRKFGVPWTAFYAFWWWTKREIDYRVVKRRSKSLPHDHLKIQYRASHLSNRFPNKI